MRLFIAFDVPPGVREHMANIQRAIGNDLARISWVKEEQMHLTLKFLGEVQPDTADKIKELLRGIKFSQFTVFLSSIGVFPNEGYVRVVWVGLEPESKVIELQKEIDLKLGKLFTKEKDFKAHITLGRVKYVEDKKQFVDRLKEINVEKREFEVSSFKLMKSTLTGEGPVYEVAEEFKP